MDFRTVSGVHYHFGMAESTQRLLATMVTTTSFGTWPPGDLRGYVNDGVILPGDPQLLARSQRLMKIDPVYFTSLEQDALFEAIKQAADEFQYALIAVSVESWHLHWLIDHAFDPVSTMVGRLKTRMRQALTVPPFGRKRVWTEGYDDRMCFDCDALDRRGRYIRRHQGWRKLPHELRTPADCDLDVS